MIFKKKRMNFVFQIHCYLKCPFPTSFPKWKPYPRERGRTEGKWESPWQTPGKMEITRCEDLRNIINTTRQIRKWKDTRVRRCGWKMQSSQGRIYIRAKHLPASLERGKPRWWLKIQITQHLMEATVSNTIQDTGCAPACRQTSAPCRAPLKSMGHCVGARMNLGTAIGRIKAFWYWCSRSGKRQKIRV